jgi:hypothetical protein
MTTTLKISRVLGVSSDPQNTSITIKVQLEDGSEVDLIMGGPTAQALAPIVHREVRSWRTSSGEEQNKQGRYWH